MQAKQPRQNSMCLSITWMIRTSCASASFMPSRKARVMCIVSLSSRFGLPFKTKIFITFSLLQNEKRKEKNEKRTFSFHTIP